MRRSQCLSNAMPHVASQMVDILLHSVVAIKTGKGLSVEKPFPLHVKVRSMNFMASSDFDRYLAAFPLTIRINRTDNLLQLHAQIDYPFKDWLFASIGYDLGKNYSDCTLTVGGLPCSYLRNDVWLRMSVAY